MKRILGLMLILVSAGVNAAWLNSAGTVASITTYAHTETVLVSISTSGADVAECSDKTVFAISKDISAEARARMYSMLLSAQATGRAVVVSYNESNGCEPWGGNSSVFRQIVRLH